MGRQWVGFQSSPRSPEGQRIEVADSFDAAVGMPRLLELLTTAGGLSEWLGRPKKFSLRRGASLDLTLDEHTFGASYELVDIPRRVVMVTERHGEIDIRMRDDGANTGVAVTIRRLVLTSESEAEVRAALVETINALRRRCEVGSQGS